MSKLSHLTQWASGDVHGGWRQAALSALQWGLLKQGCCDDVGGETKTAL
jgi:hypothetical protein